MQLQAGTVLFYQFTSTLSVKFDIHRHISDDQVEIIADSYGTTKRGPSKIKLKEDGLYCLLWKNRYKKDLLLNYRIQFEDP